MCLQEKASLACFFQTTRFYVDSLGIKLLTEILVGSPICLATSRRPCTFSLTTNLPIKPFRLDSVTKKKNELVSLNSTAPCYHFFVSSLETWLWCYLSLICPLSILKASNVFSETLGPQNIVMHYCMHITFFFSNKLHLIWSII